MKFIGAFDSWIFQHYLHLVDFPFCYWNSARLEKKFICKTSFLSKELSFLRKNINFFDEIVCREDWFIISDSQKDKNLWSAHQYNSRSEILFLINEASQTDIKGYYLV